MTATMELSKAGAVQARNLAKYAKPGADLTEIGGKAGLVAAGKEGLALEAKGAIVVAIAAFIATESKTMTSSEFALAVGVSKSRVSHYNAFGRVVTGTTLPAGVTETQLLTAASSKSGKLNDACKLPKMADRQKAIAAIIAEAYADKKSGPKVPTPGTVEGEKDGTETPEVAEGDASNPVETDALDSLIARLSKMVDTICETVLSPDVTDEDVSAIMAQVRRVSDAYALRKSNRTAAS